MPITDKRKRHKLMERAIRSLMSANLPPRFKFKDTYDSIEVPAAYTQHLPTQQEIEDKFDELETQEEAVEAVASEATVISKFDSVITSNLEVGTSNLFVDTETGRVGIGKTNPSSTLDIVGNTTLTGTVDGRDVSADGAKLDNILDTSKLKYKSGYTEVNINSPAGTSGSWTEVSNTSNWGDPKFNNTYDHYRYNDAPGHVEYNIPTGMKSAYISQLQWSTGGYVDIHGVQADGDLVFLRRINTKQSVENSNHGNPDQHDGSTITFAGSGLQTFSKIRFTNKYGRFHLTGLAFTPNENEGTEGTGLVHIRQISDRGPIAMVGRNTGRVYATNTFICNVVGYNTHGLYNSSNGRFTAPTGFPGYYLFTYTGLGGYKETSPNTRWYLNGSVFDWGAAHVNNSCTSRHGMSCQVMAYMNEGDYMYFVVTGRSLYGSSQIHATINCIYMGTT